MRCNVKGPESIADHMYRMGMMSLIAGNAGVSMDRCCTSAFQVPPQHGPAVPAMDRHLMTTDFFGTMQVHPAIHCA